MAIFSSFECFDNQILSKMSENYELSNQVQYAHDSCYVCSKDLSTIPGNLFNLFNDKVYIL